MYTYVAVFLGSLTESPHGWCGTAGMPLSKHSSCLFIISQTKPKAYGKIMLFHKTALMTVNNPFESKLPLILQQKDPPTLLTELRHSIKHLNKNKS